MRVWRVRVEADGRLAQLAVACREEAPDQLADRVLVRCTELAVDRFRRRRLAMVVHGDLEAVADVRKAVERPAGGPFPDEEREPVRPEQTRLTWSEPERRLARDGEY